VVNAGVSNQRGEWLCRYFDHYFDKVLVDVPCSGLGILQKKSEISSWWDIKRTERLAEIQYKLLVSAFKMLKEGGELVYSTCTVTAEENELIIDKFLSKFDAELMEFDVDIPSNDALTTYNNTKLNPQLKNAKRFVPFEIESEGFFIAKIRKNGKTKPVEQDMAKGRNISEVSFNKLKPELAAVIDTYGIDEEVFNNYRYYRTPKSVFFVASDFDNLNPHLFQRLGMKLGSPDSGGQLHLNSLAAQVFNKHIKNNRIDLDDKYDLKIFLEGGILKGDFSERGQVFISYRSLPVGTGILNESGLKSRFPRAHRTQDYIIPPVA
jgi:16S rRNA (cytosine1407-C5)-methyltransferase